VSDSTGGARHRPHWWRWALLALGVAFLCGSVWLFYVVRAQGGQPGWLAFFAVASLVTGLAQILLNGLALRPAERTNTAPVGGATHRHLHGEDSGGMRPAPAVPRQLPAAVAGFAGQVAELAALTSLLEQSTSTGGTVVISAVDGMAGIGKTALAVYWAHQVADRFPDGQLYVNLRGFDPAGPPMSPAEAVRGFLDAFEVPAERIPIGLDAQASLYRSILAGHRVLVVLDNARDAAQVRPLLPGSPGCFVLVTSRTRLTSLIAAEGARPLTVDLLSGAEARELLIRRLGPSRIAAEPEAVEEIISLCVRLPLALSVVAARAAMHPGFSLAALVQELRQTRGGLQAFEGGEVSDDVRAVFSWSYQRLDPAAARLFRLLGLHPGPDITAAAAASLAGLDITQVRRAVAELARYHLVTEQIPGRFGFHDLLRAYATELVATHDTDDERHAARQRMLDHYLHTAHVANLLLHPRWEPITLTAPHPGIAPEELADHTAALAWFEAEYAVLLAAVQLAATTGFHTHAWQLPSTLTEFFRRRAHWADWAATEHTALSTAQRHGDRRGQAHAHRSLGRALAWLGRYDEAHDHIQQAVDLFAELGDPAEEAESQMQLSAVFEQQGNPADALAHAQQVLDLVRTAGSPRALVRALNNIGWYHALLGQPEQALTYCQQALTLNRDLGDRRVEAITLNSLGYAHYLLGQHDQAIDYFQQAAALRPKLDNRHAHAGDLNLLGDAYHAAGDHAAARDAWQQASDILDRLGVVGAGVGPGYPEADEIHAKLHHLDAPGSRSPEQ
jgi:tetratricopeptide (TPR) repeat protein